MKKAVFILFMACHSLCAQIAVDGFYNDWKMTDFQIQDDGDNNLLDITRVWVSNDDDNLYIRIDANREFDIQDSQNITILIDADDNTGTGFEVNGIGAEISYYFGNRSAFLNYPDDFLSTNHAGVGMVALPTVTSRSFELVFTRTPSSSKGDIIMNETISISIENGSSGDKVPNISGGFKYTMKENEQFVSDYSLSKTSSAHTRVMSYNILRDGFDEQDQKEHLEAVVKALNPDIIAFQEIYDTNLSSIKDFLDQALPNSDGSSWDFAKEGPDVVVFTRGVIEAHDNIDGNGIFLLYDSEGEDPLILYNVHLPCCDNDSERQREIDRIMSVVRDREAASEVNFSYGENVPIIIAGDFNMVGESQNIKSFLEGDIDNESTFGPDFNPDWDGSNLEDANPYVTGFPSNYTWRNDNSSYNPGKLDFIFFSGSVMTQRNGFVLASEFLSTEELMELNLSENSTSLASDHLPVVVDFTFGIQDDDMDGFAADVDCDDTNASINPGAAEIANNDIDENCDGIALVIDEDMDGFNSDEDCNDMDAAINPGTVEIPNNEVDENCDGELGIVDSDMDGFTSDVDCDDMNAAINPAAEDIPNNGIDENCDGEDFLSATEDLFFSNVSIYPNPINDWLIIDAPNSLSLQLSIFDVHGQIVKDFRGRKGKIELDLRDLDQGLYILVIRNLKGSTTSRSFIKM